MLPDARKGCPPILAFAYCNKLGEGKIVCFFDYRLFFVGLFYRCKLSAVCQDHLNSNSE
ncbi:unnamed protein product [Periconia digitata]|uniref:Uncharacterized protein n=1 Tax=Periconia digitata TaxID=1303443 RepID=A0A9W4URG9_9PLEO|nr:unnamed protein product [Periconia digitata]